MGAGCQPMRGGGSRTPDLLKVHPAPPKSHNNDATHNDTKISQINTIINNIWEQYDTDKNGILDSEEFSVLVSDTMHNRGMGAASPTEEEVEELLLMVDNDGDMVITQDEFFSMMHGLMMMDSTERVEMAELSTSFCKLMIFVESLTNEMMDNEDEANGVEVDQEDPQKDQENNQEDQELTESIDARDVSTPRRQMTSKLRQRLLPVPRRDLEQQTLDSVDRNYEGKNQQELVRVDTRNRPGQEGEGVSFATTTLPIASSYEGKQHESFSTKEQDRRADEADKADESDERKRNKRNKRNELYATKEDTAVEEEGRRRRTVEGKSSVESTGYMALPPPPGPPVFRYNETSNADSGHKDADDIDDIEQSRNRREPSWEDSPV